MSPNNDYEKNARRWFIFGGIFSLALMAFMVWSDDYLINSRTEAIHNERLQEIRAAQSSLPSRSVDPRQIEAKSGQSNSH